MRYVAIALALVALASGAYADLCTFKVATVHGMNQFTISEDSAQLLYHPQPRNAMGWYWLENNGAPAGALAINGLGPNGWRDGSKTFAMTNVAYGASLNTVKLELSYYMPEGSTGWNYPSINFFLTDGLGRYGIWAPASGGAQYFAPVRNGDWMTITMDLTSANTTLSDTLGGFAIYEHNGFTNDFSQPFTYMQWGGIKNYKLAGFSSYQRNPATGWANWGSAWSTLSDAWCPFVIRNGSTSGLPPQITGTMVGDVPATEFIISDGGMKAGWGTKALDGRKVRDIAGYLERYDDPSRFPVGSGPSVAPYINVWVTDSTGTKFAVIGNEPSNPEWTTDPGSSRNFDWDTLKTKVAKAYENNDKTWLPNNGVGLTWNDLAEYTILPPTPAQLAAGWSGLGGGAPRELSTNKAYGFSWVFGDTLSNYVSGDPGYVVANPAVKNDGPEFNQYGITLNWGDTVCSAGSGYDLYQRCIRDVVVTVGATEYTGVFESDQSAPNLLYLQPAASPLYVQPGQSIVVDMNVANLTQMVGACQAMLGYNSTYLNATGVAPGDAVWNDLIYAKYSVAGEIDTAVGVNAESTLGTDADGTVAKIALQAVSEGVTKVVFRPDIIDEYLTKATFLSAMNSTAVWPAKLDSTDIVIDGTAPTGAISINSDAAYTNNAAVALTLSASDNLAGVDQMRFSNDGSAWSAWEAYGASKTWTLGAGDGLRTVYVQFTDKASNVGQATDTITLDMTAPVISIDSITPERIGDGGCALQGNVSIVVSATDATSGLAADPVVTVSDMTVIADGGSFNYHVVVDEDTANGSHSVGATVTDNAGNPAVPASSAFCVNKNQITGQIELQALAPPAGGITRSVVFVADGAKEWTVSVGFAAGSSVGTYTLADVPSGTTALSAKTAWNLRTKLTGLALGGNGQGTADFTGANKLLGGDLDGSNSVNILDYTKMKTSWGAGTVGDINGDGYTGTVDYGWMKDNWFKTGEAR